MASRETDGCKVWTVVERLKIHRTPVVPLTIVLAAFAGAMAACHPGPITVPVGGQEVHAAVNGDTVHLTPTTVHAGDVYLVLDNPMTDVVLVELSSATGESPGPLSDDDLDRIVHGDEQYTSQTSGFANSEQYGNVSRLVLAPGKYLFRVCDAVPGGRIPPQCMAVLQVLP